RPGPNPGLSILPAIAGRDDGSLAGMVGSGDEAFLLHALDEARGLVVADLQPALDVAGRDLAVPEHHRNGLIVERIPAAAALAHHAAGVALTVAEAFLRLGGDGLDIVGRALGFQEAHDLLHLVVGDEGAVEARDAAAA